MRKVINFVNHFILLAFFAVLICMGIYLSKKSSVQTISMNVDYKYEIKDYNGNVAIYDNVNDESPQIVLDIKTNTLSTTESKLVRDGIKVNDCNELKSRVEKMIN